MLNPGDILERKYQIVRLLGAGGMSNIYLCRIVGAAGPADQFWVVKEMSVSYQDPKEQETAVELFLREGALLQQLDHKNLPKVIDRFVANGKYHFVMEYVDGEDLGKLITRNPHGLPESMVLPWAIEVATVLYYLHCQQPPIIFRDMKPSNIMIMRGTVKLIDFGIARSFKPNKKKDTISIGSPGYAPPEQYSGQTDPRSDIYALGATLHHLLTGKDPTETRTPFKFESVHALKAAVSEATSNIIARSVDLDPNNRYATALEMKKALQAVAGTGTRPVGNRGSATSPNYFAAKTQMSIDVPMNLAQAALDAQNPTVSAAHGPTGTTAIGPLPPTPSPDATPAPAAVSVNLQQQPPPTPTPAPAQPQAQQPPNGPAKKPQPKPPRQPMSLVNKLFLCAATAVMLRAGREPLKKWISEHFPSIVHPPPPPVVKPTGPLAEAQEDLDNKEAMKAIAWLDHYLIDHPQDTRALMMLEDARGRLTKQSMVTVPILVPAGPAGEDVLRGALLAQQNVNWGGGSNGNLIRLVPVSGAPLPSDAVTVIGDFSAGGAPPTIPAIDLTSLPSGASDTMTSIAPASPWPGLISALKQDNAKNSICLVIPKGQFDGSTINKLSEGFKVDPLPMTGLPDLLNRYGVIVLDLPPGDVPQTVETLQPRLNHPPFVTLEPWTVPSPDASFPAGHIPDGLMTVSDWWPDPTNATSYAFTLHYQSQFGGAIPGTWAWRGYQAVLALKDALGTATGATAVELGPALHKLAPPTPTTWYELKYEKDGWKLVERVPH